MEKITETNCKQLLFEYTLKNYPQKEAEKAMPLFPYVNEDFLDMDEELKIKDFTEWFMLEYIQPKTGKTILREFLEKFVSELMLRQKLLRMENIQYGIFKIINVENDIIKVSNIKNGATYLIQTVSKNLENLKRGRIITCRIHPWDADTYRFSGILHIQIPPEEYGFITEDMSRRMMENMEKTQVNKIENMILNNNTNISAILNKYPFQWIDGISKKLGINVKFVKDDKIRLIIEIVSSNPKALLAKLPEKSQKAFEFVLTEGGIIKYGKLSGKYDDEMSFWWNERPPKSTIGLLRLYGLLHVGKMADKGRLFRVALIPKEIRSEFN